MEQGIHITRETVNNNLKLKITGIKTNKGRITIAGLTINDPDKKLLCSGIKWIKYNKILKIINTYWLVVGNISPGKKLLNKKLPTVLSIVQLNLNPINIFWVIFWKLRYKFIS